MRGKVASKIRQICVTLRVFLKDTMDLQPFAYMIIMIQATPPCVPELLLVVALSRIFYC